MANFVRTSFRVVSQVLTDLGAGAGAALRS